MTTTLLQTYTPSAVPLTPFGAMVAEKRSLLERIADIAGKAADVATLIKTPAGVRLQSAPPATARTDLNFGSNSLFKNPLFLAGAAVAVVLLLKK